MRILFLTLLALQVASMAAAQSLGDVARQEEARRKNIRESGKVYTNESLRPDTTAPAAAAAPAGDAKPATPPSGQPADAKPAETKPVETKAEEPKKDQKYWQDRVKAERDALDRAKTFGDALQSRINGLSTDFAARDDPFQRAQVSADRNKALAELDRVKTEIQQHQKALNDIQEEARKAGVPAGWTR